MARKANTRTRSTLTEQSARLFECWPQGSPEYTHEKAWNAYPYCRTVITSEYMKEDFLIKIETWHKPDLGTLENVHKLEPEAWKHVEVVYIDIADRSQVLSKDYKAEEDPAKFKSIKTGRGPLGPNWKQELVNQKDCPYMCAYKQLHQVQVVGPAHRQE